MSLSPRTAPALNVMDDDVVLFLKLYYRFRSPVTFPWVIALGGSHSGGMKPP